MRRKNKIGMKKCLKKKNLITLEYSRKQQPEKNDKKRWKDKTEVEKSRWKKIKKSKWKKQKSGKRETREEETNRG